MKKLMFALMLVLFGLVGSDASAGYRNCGRRCERRCPEPCPVQETVARPCKVDYVQEDACPATPCCVKYVRVEEPALVTKHISYSAECPTGCTAEQKAAGMMKAGETLDY